MTITMTAMTAETAEAGGYLSWGIGIPPVFVPRSRERSGVRDEAPEPSGLSESEIWPIP